MRENSINNETLMAVGLAILATVVTSWVFAVLVRALLRRRAKLRQSTAMVLSMLGISAGMMLTTVVASGADLLSAAPLLLCLALSVAFIAGYAAIATRFQRKVPPDIETLLTAGESRNVEFKSTARVNLHTGQKDARMEQVIAKTVAAFLNAEGGTLLIGVDDTGTAIGLDADLATMKEPDVDRYELWLRDLLATTLGATAAPLARVEFKGITNPTHDPAGGIAEPTMVCRIEVAASPRPVYLRTGKSEPPELWVRTGNSTRRLSVDDAVEYIMHRWPLSLGANLAAQLRAIVRFSGS